MPRVSVELPSLLADAARGARSVSVEAERLDEALERLVSVHPALRVHLYDEEGDFREHVHCYHNGTNTRWLSELDVPLADGDEIVVVQAVSGG